MLNKKPNELTPEQALHQAVRLCEAGNFPTAEIICKRIINAEPDYHPAYFQLAVIASKVGKANIAVKLTQQAIKLNGKISAYHRALGELYRRSGKLKEALTETREAIKLSPKDAESYYNLGLIMADSKKYQEAVKAYRKVIELNPSHNLAANNLGSALEKIGDEKAAVEAYKKAISINPKHAEAQNNLGAIFSAHGKLDEARKHFQAAIEANNNFIYSHYNLSSLKKYTTDDPHLKSLEDIEKRIRTLSKDSQIKAGFALAKAREDVGRFDDAWQAYEFANKIKRSTINYDYKKTEQEVSKLIKSFSKEFVNSNKIKGFEDSTPIFILGMPRSGTSLIEQIISSHDGVYGAGELKDLPETFKQFSGISIGSSYGEWLKNTDEKTIQNIGKAYLKKLKSHNKTAQYITDKMPGNFFYIGLIHLALPNAKIIHSIRNPLDTCFSNYSRLFNDTMAFAYDLNDLGHYYNSYNLLMEHWKKVLPKGTILDVNYEDVVDDLKKQSKRIIKFCGLDWDDKCLEFHKNERQVKTASVAQVREPIYKTSVERWKNFEKHLKSLKNIIEGAK